MKRRTLLLLILCLSVLVGGMHLGFKKQPDSDYLNQMTAMMKAPVNWQGRFAPDFELETLDGKPFKLSENIGKKVIILNFFATWCGPCKEEIPELNRFFEKYQYEQVVMLGINSSEKPDAVAAFIQDVNIRFPVAIDKTNAVRKKFGVSAFPTTVLIGVDGKVHLYEMGAIMNSDVAFKKPVETNLKAIQTGAVVSLEDYRKGAAQEHYANAKPDGDKEESGLEGRSKEIAARMDCPCGCSDKVLECSCNTATAIKKKLKEGNFDNRTDAEIIKGLNAEFCVKE